MIVLLMLEENAEAITAKAIEKARNGELAAIKLCLDRLMPVTSDASISIPIPKITSAADGAAALAAVVEGVGNDTISVNQGAKVTEMISTTINAIATMDMERRIAALEKSAAEKPR